MRKVAIIAVLSLFLGSSFVMGQPTIRPELPDGGMENTEEPDHTKDKACRCCEECMAAMSATKGKEEAAPKTTGCRTCCKHCGKVQHPIEKQMPPEIVK